MTLLILHSLPPDSVPAGRERLEFDLTAGVESIAAVTPGAIIAGVRGDVKEVVEAIGRYRPDVVFNACEEPFGRSELGWHSAALLEWLDIPFTGCGSATLAVCQRKDFTNAILAAADVAIPDAMGFPCIVKPALEHGSIGVHRHSICTNPDELTRVRGLIDGPVVIQRFLPGREFAVALWGGIHPEQSAVGEICFVNGLRLITYAAKWLPASDDWINSPVRYDTDLAPALRTAVIDVAIRAWDALGVRGYARVDVRLDEHGVPHVLDVNPNPDLTPGGGIQRAVVEAGWTWEQFVRKQIEWASAFARS